jgi:hypothetical protein
MKMRGMNPARIATVRQVEIQALFEEFPNSKNKSNASAAKPIKYPTKTGAEEVTYGNISKTSAGRYVFSGAGGL